MSPKSPVRAGSAAGKISHFGVLAAALTCGLLRAQIPNDLPGYAPPPPGSGVQVNGEIRTCANKALTNLLRLWEVGFAKFHGGACHVDILESGAITIGALYTGVADIGFSGHRAYPMEILGFNRALGYSPVELVIGRGSFDTPGQGPCNIVFVNRENPLSQLTLRQLDGIFGNQRTGGWDGFRWSAKLARGPEGNIRTWGQAGLTGEWADKEIRTYGYALTEGSYSLWFQEGVFKGADAWNPNLTESPLAELNKAGPHLGGLHTLEAIAADRYGIGYTNMLFYEMNKKLAVKPVALAARDGGPFAEPTRENFLNRSYPLLESAYLYVNCVPGKPIDPTLKQFLRYILSREGQEDVAQDGGYLPLNADEMFQELKKLQ